MVSRPKLIKEESLNVTLVTLHLTSRATMISSTIRAAAKTFLSSERQSYGKIIRRTWGTGEKTAPMFDAVLGEK